MKLIALFACALAVAMADDAEDMMKKIKKWEEECAESLEIPPEELKAMHDEKDTIPTEKPGTCMIACMMEKFGVMNDDGLDQEAIEEALKAMMTAKHGSDEGAHVIATECSTKVAGIEDKCDAAGKFMSCAHDHKMAMMNK